MMWRGVSIVLLLSSVVSAEELPRSEASDVPLRGVLRTPLPPQEVEGRPLARVFYDLKGTSGITGGDARARAGIEKAFAIRAGEFFGVQLAELGVFRVQQLDFVSEASYSVYESSRPGHLVLALSVVLGPGDDLAGPQGVLAGRMSDFPILYQNERGKLLTILNGAFGLYTELDPWFGDSAAFTSQSPIALDPADGGTDSWFELSVEYGLAGVVQLGDSPFWTYGAATLLTSFSAGNDLFRSDTREWTDIEDAYAGVVVQPPGSEWVFNLSAGRQSWQLNDGFLISQFAGAANAGPLPGLFLNPRTAFEMTGLFRATRNNFRFEAFYLDPAEIDFLDSDTAFLGGSMALHLENGFEGSATYYEAVDSDTVFSTNDLGDIPREGQQTANLRLGTSRLFGVDHLEFMSEVAYQTHRDVDWRAWAYYARAGYTFESLPWTPNLSYRYASFSGDDPSTKRYERFDAPLSSGLDTWVQGIVAKKVVSNSNLDSHRIRLNVAPSPKLSFTLDYFWLMANETAGGAYWYAQEVDLAVRWSISRNLFFLGVAGVAFPDDRLRDRAGSDLDSWGTLQASLFWNF